MRHQLIGWIATFWCVINSIFFFPVHLSAHAAPIDAYVRRYLQVNEPTALNLDHQGNTQLFTADDISQGKLLFEENCLNCHVGGSTLPNPAVSLSLNDLQNAVPPRDTIAGLVAYIRQPMTYDGSEENLVCRQVPESWMDQKTIKNLAAFIVRAAQKAPGWGGTEF